jgi:TBC1 domain family protein 5
MRAEIEQDVRRLPDEPFYHTDRIQTLILDVLFVWCKLHPRAGGYRQGMHELLAPMVLVLEQDSVLRGEVEAAAATADGGDVSGAGDTMMLLEMLDADFLEHDAYALFKRLMQAAVEFYQLGDADAGGRGGAIVEKSRAIHEYYLKTVDPELSEHFTDIEVLPQIFLM